jgi:UDP-N-acetyl-D-galactosamine dehydrogenase
VNKLSDLKVAVIGLGYVGLPLALEFGRQRNVVGFDINLQRVADLLRGEDHTLEATAEELSGAKYLTYSSNVSDLSRCNCYIVTVPTPIDEAKKPDLTPLIHATKTVGSVLKQGDIVIYESTVYPGCTEEDCVPILESISGLCFNKDFYCGYSPERINPGDKDHRLPSIVKVTSGSTEEAATVIDSLYQSIISAGTYRAPNIKVAEAAKVIENTQRDINIALMNELSIIFGKMEIDTEEVLKAAGTKWNFLPFRPGLVGGHCIGVDPYYLTYKSESLGYSPEIILAGRRINDGMGEYVAKKQIGAMESKGINIKTASILIAGLAFKENCPDIRNTRAVDVYRALLKFGVNVDFYDPWVDKAAAMEEYSLTLTEELKPKYYDGIIFAVAHREFAKFTREKIKSICKDNYVIYDLKYLLDSADSDLRL